MMTGSSIIGDSNWVIFFTSSINAQDATEQLLLLRHKKGFGELFEELFEVSVAGTF